jgi:hypothetical protein
MRTLGCASIPSLDPSIAMYCGNRSSATFSWKFGAGRRINHGWQMLFDRTQPNRSSRRGGPSVSGCSDRRFAAASAPEGKMYVISQPLSRFPSVTSSMIGGVNQAKCAPPILPSQDRAVDHHDFTKKTEVKLPDSS